MIPPPFVVVCRPGLRMFDGSSASGLTFFMVVPALGDEAVAYPGFCLDVLSSGFRFELFAQLSYEYAQILGLVRGLRSPDGGEQYAVGHDLACIARQIEQQVELLGRKVDGLSLDGDGVRQRVHYEVALLDGLGGSFGGSAQVSAYAGQ